MLSAGRTYLASLAHVCATALRVSALTAANAMTALAQIISDVAMQASESSTSPEKERNKNASNDRLGETEQASVLFPPQGL